MLRVISANKAMRYPLDLVHETRVRPTVLLKLAQLYNSECRMKVNRDREY